ncbi:MAG: beta-ketoacyl-ACP synthase III [Actinomycetales bacterium]|nr:beta-ketoacyl-ACP synthase III [Actinomycetales bacterium]
MSAAITPSVGAPFARILSVGGYKPARVVANAEICERIDSSDEWIRERSGIIERRWAAPDESVADLATNAATVALDRAGIGAEQVGMVLLATVTHPYQTPSASAEVAARIGAVNAAAMDISAACAGFCYGVSLASDMVRGGSARYVVVVGVEKLSDWIDMDDRSTAFLFADGAGAVVIGPSEEPAIGPVVWGSDGDQRDAITMTQSLIDYKHEGGDIFPSLVMQGQQVFRWAVGEMSKACVRALDVAGVDAGDLDAFIPHQANMRITDAMVRALKLPEHVPVARDIAYTGNTSAASIPLAMEAMLESGEAPHGGTALIIGFGAGLVYAAQVVTLP